MKLTTKQLIADNNSKREQLTEDNQKYFEQLLVYIRSQFLVNERQTEEVLTEMLDHLLLAQNEGRSAQDVFGRAPKAFADEVLDALPKDKKRSQWDFLLEMLMMLFGWILVGRGIFTFIQGKDEQFYLYSFSILCILMVIFMGIFVELIFKMIRDTAFDEDEKKFKKGSILYGFAVAITLTPIIYLLTMSKFSELGPEIIVSKYTSLGLGAFLLLGSYLLKLFRESK